MQELDPDDSDTAPVESAYYTNTGRKVPDFLIGFLSCIVLAISVYAWKLRFSPAMELRGVNAMLVSIFVTIVFAVVLLIVAYILKRKFIATGVFATLLIAAIGFGSCLLTIGK